jgi:hypothetical protein
MAIPIKLAEISAENARDKISYHLTRGTGDFEIEDDASRFRAKEKIWGDFLYKSDPDLKHPDFLIRQVTKDIFEKGRISY